MLTGVGGGHGAARDPGHQRRVHRQDLLDHHRFDDADAWAARFEDPKRDAWQRPDEVIALLALAPDAKVADIGSATGYFPVRVARAVPQGHVELSHDRSQCHR
jgi:hypothetical protein